MELQGKRAVITGANGNLGRALDHAARALGAQVVRLDQRFDDDPGDEAASDGARIFTVDLLDQAGTKRCFDAIGAVDLLFNVAGGFAMGEATHLADDAVFARMHDLNVRTLLNCVRSAVPGMLSRGRGAIVNVAAASALKGQPGMAAYCAAKSTVVRLTESMSQELRSGGVRVNCVLPSVIDTPENRRAMPDADHATWVTPADLASVMCFLASERAAAMHGAAVPVLNRV